MYINYNVGNIIFAINMCREFHYFTVWRKINRIISLIFTKIIFIIDFNFKISYTIYNIAINVFEKYKNIV